MIEVNKYGTITTIFYASHPELSKLPPLEIPEGLIIKTRTDDMVQKWEDIIYKAFNVEFKFEQCIINGRTIGGYKPEGENVVATATATERDDCPGKEWFRMIASNPEVRENGLGKLICLAALYSLKERGYSSAVLSTDDD